MKRNLQFKSRNPHMSRTLSHKQAHKLTTQKFVHHGKHMQPQTQTNEKKRTNTWCGLSQKSQHEKKYLHVTNPLTMLCGLAVWCPFLLSSLSSSSSSSTLYSFPTSFVGAQKHLQPMQPQQKKRKMLVKPARRPILAGVHQHEANNLHS